MAKKKRVNISVNLKDSDRDIEAWLESKKSAFKKEHGVDLAITQVIMSSLRKQMEAEKK